LALGILHHFARFAFDRFAKFAALSRLGRSCYTREDRQPFSVLACREGFERLGELLDSDCSFDPRKAEVENFDAELRSLFEEERSTAVHVEIVEELQQRAKEARFRMRSMESLQKCRLTDVFANLEVGRRQDSRFQLLRHLLVL